MIIYAYNYYLCLKQKLYLKMVMSMRDSSKKDSHMVKESINSKMEPSTMVHSDKVAFMDQVL